MREIHVKPHWMRNPAVPRAEDEISLAVKCTSEARAQCTAWNRVMIQASTKYNMSVFWIAATKSNANENANEQLRQMALKWGLAEGGRSAPETASEGGAGAGSGGGTTSGAGGVPSGHGRTKAAGTKPAGSAGPGETLVMTDAEIEGLGRNVLRLTLRSLEGVGVGSDVKHPELVRRLKAVRAGKRRKITPPT